MNSKIKRIIGGTFIAGAILGGGAAIGAGTASAACMGSGVDDVSGAPCGSSGSGGTVPDRSGETRNYSVHIDTDGDGSADTWTNQEGTDYGSARDTAQDRGYGVPGPGTSPVV